MKRPNRMTIAGLAAWGMLAIAAGCGKESSPSSGRAAKTIQFPRDRSMGSVRIEDRGSSPRYRTLGEATGKLEVPAGKGVWLTVTGQASFDLSPLSKLRPDDIQWLSMSLLGRRLDLVHLRGLTGLRSLDLSMTATYDNDLRHLAGLSSLEVLDLSRTAVTDAGLKHLKGLTSLRELNLRMTATSDNDLRHLEALSSLVVLDLSQTDVTDGGLKHLRGLTWLRELYLGETQTTYEERQLLQRILSDCAITTQDRTMPGRGPPRRMTTPTPTPTPRRRSIS